MKRRDFVKHTSLASAGILLVPAVLSRQSSLQAANVVSIAQGGEHVRHGLFAPRAIENNALPSWLKLFERHVFYGNGITPGAGDLQSFSFEVGGQSFALALKGNKTLFSSEQETLSIPATGSCDMYSNEHFNIRLQALDAGSTIKLHSGQDRAFIPIYGKLWINDTIPVNAFECYIVNREDSYQLHGKRASQVLVISRKTG